MNFNEKIRNEQKIVENQGVYLLNYSYLSCVMPYSTKLNIKVMLKHDFLNNICRYEKGLICLFIDVNENIRNEWKIADKSRCVLTKLLICQTIKAIEYLTLFQFNA